MSSLSEQKAARLRRTIGTQQPEQVSASPGATLQVKRVGGNAQAGVAGRPKVTVKATGVVGAAPARQGPPAQQNKHVTQRARAAAMKPDAVALLAKRLEAVELRVRDLGAEVESILSVIGAAAAVEAAEAEEAEEESADESA